jgi:hypothetical protein
VIRPGTAFNVGIPSRPRDELNNIDEKNKKKKTVEDGDGLILVMTCDNVAPGRTADRVIVCREEWDWKRLG